MFRFSAGMVFLLFVKNKFLFFKLYVKVITDDTKQLILLPVTTVYARIFEDHSIHYIQLDWTLETTKNIIKHIRESVHILSDTLSSTKTSEVKPIKFMLVKPNIINEH